ncbi:MAG: CapA family protein, partial [Actinobacteria bacterium]|nr:CapA family protein [Actinomycetota bacterium]
IAIKVGGNIKNSDADSSTTSDSYGNDLNDGTGTVLFLTEETEKIISVVFGDRKNSNIKIVSGGEIKKSLESNPDSFAVIPFEELRKEFKVLNIDGKSVFDKDFSYESYPFSFSVSFGGYDFEKAQKLKEAFERTFFSNRDSDKLTVINMTGVTALVRGVANRMDSKGALYPGEKIAEILKNADITHISNEISFKEDCNAGQSGTIFCSKPGYIELLKSIGTDLVELTGNHLNDYGSQYLESTLKIYEGLGWKYFGGGPNLSLSKEPALYNMNGNKIAFLGFNQFGPSYDWATRNSAGSAPPDNSYYLSEIKRLKEQGYNVIFTFQYEESYSYSPLDKQVEDFRMMRDAGADIVNGSQAHQPMGFEITRDSLICYGLGNLFFDQMQSLGTRQGIIAKHVFYNGKYISTQLIPTIIDDYCQPRPMNDIEKKDFLRSLYEASFN